MIVLVLNLLENRTEQKNEYRNEPIKRGVAVCRSLVKICQLSST